MKILGILLMGILSILLSPLLIVAIALFALSFIVYQLGVLTCDMLRIPIGEQYRFFDKGPDDMGPP